MTRRRLCRAAGPALALGLALGSPFAGAALQEKAPPDLDLTDFRTIERAVTVPAGKILATSTARPTPYLGAHVAAAAGHLVIAEVEPGSPAAAAGLQKGDVLLTVCGKSLPGVDALRDLLHGRNVGDTVGLSVQRRNVRLDFKIALAPASRPLHAAPPPPAPARGGFDKNEPYLWKKDVYRLAVVPVEFPDVKHNDKITPAAWEAALFSKGSFTDKNATGQKVWGSLNDYYQAQSFGKFRVTGKVFEYVPVAGRRADYPQNDDRYALLTEALDRLLDREGEEAVNEFDGACFVYAGAEPKSPRGSLYWPHTGTFRYRGVTVPYMLCPEGGGRMQSISLLCHEMGHLLGLPDLYARPEAPDLEGVGVWCTMATGHGRAGKPVYLSAWCRGQLGWLTPAVLDPRVKQKLILRPADTSPRECYKVLVRPDGSEYLLLENRVARGWDRDLPGQGLVIWRVANGRPTLVEAHGVAGPAGSRRFASAVPYPGPANNAFTPYTIPSSNAPGGGGLPVHLSNIRRLPDGRVVFYIGYEFL